MLNSAPRTGIVNQLRIGVDSGGTFTDVSIYNETTGDIFIWKVSSTPDDPSRGILEGVTQAIDNYVGRENADVVFFGHGTTVATNAVIQKKGARTGLVTTEGFRDVLEIARQVRPGLYNLKVRRPEPLAARNDRYEVAERMTSTGEVQTPLDADAVREAAHRFRETGVGAIAVCLLNSYRNPEHEQQIGAILAEEYPEAFVSVSTDIAQEYREFERTSTAVLNSYVGPIIKNYLEKLTPKLSDAGVTVTPHLTQSNGGVISFEQAKQQPVRTILSGPAAGVVGATAVARLAGLENIITFDMGGTSTDVALIESASPRLSADAEVHGYPLRVPMLDIETVGAGGGSIAAVDSGGLLEVGPMSAGAFPGPACYEKGNTRPTVTDANVLLQVLNPVSLLAGRMPISQPASRSAIAAVAAELGVDVMEAAQGIISMAVASMVKAVRVISIERGHDPRDFALMAFGGAGPVHATRLARELGIRKVLVPKTPGVLCSLGLLLSDLKTNFASTELHLAEASSHNAIEAQFDKLKAKALAWFDAEHIPEEDRVVNYSIDMRYVGQGHELNVPCNRDMDARAFAAAMRVGFEKLHKQMYGYVVDGEAIQAATYRLEATAKVKKAPLRSYPMANGPVSAAIMSEREIYLPEAGGFVCCPIYNRDDMGPGHVVHGPAIVEQMDSTTLVLPEQTATVDAFLNLIVEGRT